MHMLLNQHWHQIPPEEVAELAPVLVRRLLIVADAARAVNVVRQAIEREIAAIRLIDEASLEGAFAHLKPLESIRWVTF